MSPRTGEQFEKMRDTTKAKIEQSATALFSKQGLSVTIAHIATHAHISQGLLYQHFASKEALIRTLVEKAQHNSAQAIAAVFATDISAQSKIELISHMMIDMLQTPEHEGTQLFLFMIQVGMNMKQEYLPSLAVEEASKPMQYLSQIIEQGQSEESIKSGSPYSLALLYWAAVQGLCCYSLVGMNIPHEPELLSYILLK